ncbi:MAG: hypothetical protein N3D10_04010 [Candidatus Micrarchaeota archaeon]|nr:hypothetical protein [Candidatus Micrarchaeota archaeon]
MFIFKKKEKKPDIEESLNNLPISVSVGEYKNGLETYKLTVAILTREGVYKTRQNIVDKNKFDVDIKTWREIDPGSKPEFKGFEEFKNYSELHRKNILNPIILTFENTPDINNDIEIDKVLNKIDVFIKTSEGEFIKTGGFRREKVEGIVLGLRRERLPVILIDKYDSPIDAQNFFKKGVTGNYNRWVELHIKFDEETVVIRINNPKNNPKEEAIENRFREEAEKKDIKPEEKAIAGEIPKNKKIENLENKKIYLILDTSNSMKRFKENAEKIFEDSKQLIIKEDPKAIVYSSLERSEYIGEIYSVLGDIERGVNFNNENRKEYHLILIGDLYSRDIKIEKINEKKYIDLSKYEQGSEYNQGFLEYFGIEDKEEDNKVEMGVFLEAIEQKCKELGLKISCIRIGRYYFDAEERDRKAFDVLKSLINDTGGKIIEYREDVKIEDLIYQILNSK